MIKIYKCVISWFLNFHSLVVHFIFTQTNSVSIMRCNSNVFSTENNYLCYVTIVLELVLLL